MTDTSDTNGRVAREGPFWDVMAGRAAPPPSAALLGWELVAVDPEAGTIEVAFTATEQFLNPIGVIQGGLLAAMLDDTMGPALVATLGPGQFGPTRRVAEPASTAFTRTMSFTGTPSVIHTTSSMPASIASRIESAAPAGGT